MAIKVDLFSDFVGQTRNNLNIDQSVDQLEVVRLYAWYDLRRLPQRKWHVHYSNELQQNVFFVNNRKYIDAIRVKAEVGKDITSHASTLIDNITGKDDMLADWGIYHLHPGHGTRTARLNGFVNRAGELLFVFPKGDNLYFLDVLDHRSWTNFSLIKIIDDNWPSTIEQYKLKGVTGLAHEPTEQDLYELRKNQVNSPFRVGNSFFMGPGGGLATDGISIKTLRMAQNVEELLNNCATNLKENEASLRTQLEEKSGRPLTFTTLNLKLLKYEPKNGTGEIQETNSRMTFQFNVKRV